MTYGQIRLIWGYFLFCNVLCYANEMCFVTVYILGK